MSIEIFLYTESTYPIELCKFLRQQGFTACENIAIGTIEKSKSYHWFETDEYKSFQGVEANVYPIQQEELNDKKGQPGTWVLHTRTPAWASYFDRDQQNTITKIAREKFGGRFYNDSAGWNRYIKLDEKDKFTKLERACYLLCSGFETTIRQVRWGIANLHAIPNKEALEIIGMMDPMITIYNALIPFCITFMENFFKALFGLLISHKYETESLPKDFLNNKIEQKVTFKQILNIKKHDNDIGFILEQYNFQNLNSIQKAYSLIGIDIDKLLSKKFGKINYILWLRNLLELRHKIIHEFNLHEKLNSVKKVDEYFINIEKLIKEFSRHFMSKRLYQKLL